MDRRNFVAAAPLIAAGGAVVGAEAAATETAHARHRHFEVMKAVIMGWRQGDRQAVIARCADDIVWYSHVGSPPIVGKDATAKFMEALSGQMKDVRWRIFSYAEHGDTAFAEGVDEFTSPEGRQVALPYAGVMRFRDGLITEWRDYFDRGLFDRLKAGEATPPHVAALTGRTPLY
jgi:limonene-1,2-epoxide hydrolase